MLSISFDGWAQCRLATDPDPYDEPRGVSGYMQAYAGEPDLDRMIRFRDPPLVRSYTQAIDVRVRSVNLDGAVLDEHSLENARVDLLDSAVFEGRNGAIAEDGWEPIYPFHIKISTDDHWFSRAIVPTDPNSPYREFVALPGKTFGGVTIDPGFIERATGIASLPDVWQARLPKIKADLDSADVEERPAIAERIDFINRNLAAPNFGAARFFPARMEWKYALRSDIEESPDALKKLFPSYEITSGDWLVKFWFGAWDADAAAFFVSGVLEFNHESHAVTSEVIARPERMTDIER